jgi:hypothetical protein
MLRRSADFRKRPLPGMPSLIKTLRLPNPKMKSPR